MPQYLPLASIIIPNFNHARYLGDAIRSVLNQQYRHFEIIVVDDGSTDNSRDVVAQFGDAVRYIWQTNHGLSAARNTGIQAAQGEYIGVLDADDMYEPAFLSTLVPILQANGDAQAVYCGYRFVDEANRPLPQVEARRVSSAHLFQALVDGNFLVPESILVRKQCYDQVGYFDESLSALEDLDMWLRITSRYLVLGTTEILTRHRVLPTSMSTDPSRQCNNRLRVIEKHFGQEQSDVSQMRAAQRRAFAKAYLAATIEHLQARQVERAIELFQQMTRLDPSLLLQPDTCYEFGCGDQPKGFRGDFATLDVARNAQVFLRMLDSVFAHLETMDDLYRQKNRVYANAYFTIGLLYYGKREFRRARISFLQAILMNPRYALNRQLVSRFIKSLFGTKLIDTIKRRSHPFAH